jgi:hypothetical protein
MSIARLRLEPWQQDGEEWVVAASLDDPEGRPHRLWWRLPAPWGDALTPWADPFLVGFLFPLMQWRREVFVEGRVSPTLLAHLECLMAFWNAWEPHRYVPVRITAAEEVECPPPSGPHQVVMPFSGGVDSCFTVFRHRRGLVGRRKQHIGAAAVMHGFDIWLDQGNGAALYRGLLNDCRTMLDSLGVAVIPMTSNFHELPTVWAHSFGTHLLSGLHLLAGRFGGALLGNSAPYTCLTHPWGNHPTSDRWLGREHFRVDDDGGEALRWQKAQVLAAWPEAMRYLRVCFQNPDSHRNCCRCEKCVRTILSFRAAGVTQPAAFAHAVANCHIRRLRFTHPDQEKLWAELLDAAGRQGLGRASWVEAAHYVVWRNRWRRRLNRVKSPFLPLRNHVRRLFRGSPLSRRQLAAQAEVRKAVMTEGTA